MKISGAIFDCDGTILDSMPMWNKIFPDWLNSHNIPPVSYTHLTLPTNREV